MAEVLFITPAEMAATTILGGNVDVDKYIVNIAFTQLSVIEPLLGSELYDKILADLVAGTLTGDYETLFTEYVQPITKHEALAEYIEVSNFMVDNGGTFRHTAENRENTTKDDTQFLAGKYHSLAQMYIKRFEKWICKNKIDEYKRYQDEVNAQNVEVKAGWYFGKTYGSVNGINECDL
jgi:hypothetical protein